MRRAPVPHAVPVALLVAAASCGSAPSASPTGPGPGRIDGVGAPTAPGDAATPAPLAATIVALVETPLPHALLAIEGDDAVLAVSQSADEPTAFVQRLDLARQVLAPAIALDGHFVGAAWAGEPGRTTLLTTHRDRLCLVAIGAGRIESTTCDPVRADAVVKVGDRFLTLTLDRPLPDPDAPPPPPPPRERKKPGKKPRAERPASTEATSPARRQLALLGHWFGAEPVARRPRAAGAPERGRARSDRRATPDEDLEDPFETGLLLEEPMAGLGLVGAGFRRLRDGTPRVDVVAHEWVGPVRDRGSKALGRARYVAAALDVDGALVADTRAGFGEADLFFGFLAGSLAPRLMTPGAGSVLLTNAATRGPCQATVISPGRAPMGPSRAACALDPGRFLAAAERMRRPPKDRDHKAKLVADDQAFEALAAPLLEGGAHRAEHQARWDAPLAVVTPRRGVTRLGSGQLVSFDREDASLRDEPAPLVARRARAFGASIALDGEALIRTHDGLRRVTADGAVTTFPDPLPPGPPRSDERALAPSPFARIGDTWWTSRGGPVRVVPAAGPAPLGERAPQTAVLVGGASTGLWLELDGAGLAVSSLDAEGRVRRLARQRAPVTIGFDAAERDGGGAVVVGPAASAPGRLATFVVSSEGAIGTVFHALDAGLYGLAPRIVAMPGGGAVVIGVDGRRHAWLAADGSLVAQKQTPARPPTGCIDGAALPSQVPTPRPELQLEVPDLATEGTCVVGLPAWSRDGTLRVVASQRRGIDATIAFARASLPLGLGRGPDAPAAPTVAAPAAPAGPSRCPPEMVLVDQRVCVDRFETAVVEGATGRLAAPDYPITPNLFAGVLGDWATQREVVGDALARAMPLPRPAPFQLQGVTRPISTTRVGVLPSGYLTGLVAKEVCAAAGKRLCTKDEWRTACRGERKTRFPYGDAFREGVCNVARNGHPASTLHGHASIGHLDPRLGRVVIDGGPGLRPTGSHPGCASAWDGDALYDMVGNLDEWIDVEGGAFAGGFYARRTTSGCDAIVENHPPSYLDYSTGVRCCATAAPGVASGAEREPTTR